jgi:hypothetical protein
MDYKARFYSAYLNRFQQPDSIIPNPADPQNWNRYAYVNNNPVKYIDPTGHHIANQEGGCPDNANYICGVYPENHEKEEKIIPEPESDDKEFLWKIIPTTYVFNIGLTNQFGVVAEPASSVEWQFAYNIRNNEFDVLFVDMLTNSGTGERGLFHIGAPTLWGYTVNVGITMYKGASSNSVLLGDGNFIGADLQIDAIAKAGVSREFGYALKPGSNIMPYIDEFTHMPITYRTYARRIWTEGDLSCWRK